MEDVKEQMIEMPAIPLRQIVVLPGIMTSFDVTRQKSKQAVESALQQENKIFVVKQKDPDIESPGSGDLYSMGTIALIRQVIRLTNGSTRILIEGLQKARLVELSKESPILIARVKPVIIEDKAFPPEMEEAMKRGICELFDGYVKAGARMNREIAAEILKKESLKVLIREVGGRIPVSAEVRQRILDAEALEEEYEALGQILSYETAVLLMQKDIQDKVRTEISKAQRDYWMREQIRVMRKELGEDSISTEAEEYRARLEEFKLEEEQNDRIGREISRYSRMNPNAPDSNVQRSYLETVFEIPWGKVKEENHSLKNASVILEEGHYGLKDVKDRVLEYLAVRLITEEAKSPILCLCGPPGTGKTSIAKSLAQALEVPYVRVCLGGVKDEAEIRGHRRTYIGALMGNIASALRQAKAMNPLILLDEIDKTGRDESGDVSSALLEVLDPEQNSHFTDHYLEIPLDLSKVFFIATANDSQAIPKPLLDRMEIIHIPGYSENEKLHIAKRHLIGKQKKENGIPDLMLTFTDAALVKMINFYTKEAGVRNLEREIGRICRKRARMLLEGETEEVRITVRSLEEYLGKPHYHILMANKTDEIGIARGLAWTQTGGDTLQIEVNTMPGEGELIMTGKLGDVMKESAQAGISFIRSIADQYGISQDYFHENDLHVHIPEGAVPKDGPSAGITMAAAMLSAITGRAVRADVAMTGEITLRGRVLPIGGLKEKLLAAKAARLREILVPRENRPDVEELDAEITRGLTITYVDRMQEVLDRAFA